MKNFQVCRKQKSLSIFSMLTLMASKIILKTSEPVIVDSNLNFNVICISETSQKESAMFCNNIDLKNYHTPISTGTKTAKGGNLCIERP